MTPSEEVKLRTIEDVNEQTPAKHVGTLDQNSRMEQSAHHTVVRVLQPPPELVTLLECLDKSDYSNHKSHHRHLSIAP